MLSPSYAEVRVLVEHWAALSSLGIDISSDGALSDGTGCVKGDHLLLQDVLEVHQYFLGFVFP